MVEVHAVYMMDDFDCMYFNMNSSNITPQRNLPLACLPDPSALYSEVAVTLEQKQ